MSLVYVQAPQTHFGTLLGYLNKTKMEELKKMEKKLNALSSNQS